MANIKCEFIVGNYIYVTYSNILSNVDEKFQEYNVNVPYKKGFIHAQPCYKPVNIYDFVKVLCFGHQMVSISLGSN